MIENCIDFIYIGMGRIFWDSEKAAISSFMIRLQYASMSVFIFHIVKIFKPNFNFRTVIALHKWSERWNFNKTIKWLSFVPADDVRKVFMFLMHHWNFYGVVNSFLVYFSINILVSRVVLNYVSDFPLPKSKNDI